MNTNAQPRAAVPACPMWRRKLRHRFAHLWPRLAAAYVPDLRIRLPAATGDPQVAALTFDDGPTRDGTGRLLDCLDRHGVRATFFLLGENVRRWPRMARDIVSAGHSVGNHFRQHVDCWKISPREVIREVTEGTRIIEEVLGLTPAWCRPPFGRLTHAIVKWSRLHHQQIVLWDVFPPDYLAESTPAGLAQVLETRLRPRSIVCLHDNPVSMANTPVMLDETLPRLIDRGWSFVPMTTGEDHVRPSATDAAA